MSMELMNNIQADLLEHLGRFGFLAVSQFQVLTGKSAGYIREMLGRLSRWGYIKSYRVEVSYKVRAENSYFLTLSGKEFLLSHKNAFADDVKLPLAKNPVVTKDYFHRLSFVTLHICLYQYLLTQGIPLTAFHTYFDKTGNVRQGTLTAKTKIPLEKGAFYIPDGVMITGHRLFLLEMYCDKDSKRIINQLATHAKAITLGTPGKAFGIQDNPLVLSVFAHEGIKKAVISRLQESDGFTSVAHLYFFATLEDVKSSVAGAFKTITNETLVFT